MMTDTVRWELRVARRMLIVLAAILTSAGSTDNLATEISVADAAAYLLKRFDVGSLQDPSGGPDGMWNYQELAQYVNASKRPAGEELNVTASNLMLVVDTDRSDSITLKELEDFLQDRRDVLGLNGEEGSKRAAAKRKANEDRLKEQALHITNDGDKTWVLGDKMTNSEQNVDALAKLGKSRAGKRAADKKRGKRRARKAKDEI